MEFKRANIKNAVQITIKNIPTDNFIMPIDVRNSARRQPQPEFIPGS
ncbi:hypothetical protein GCM10022296_13950 [Secundilactobacillus similis DSM 23365 = JCM 2765]